MINDDWNKVNTKKQLLELLMKYKGILTENMVDYLESLINLEISVIREYISDSDRKALAELEIYKKVAIYNIYKRAQNLFKKQEGEFVTYGNNKGNEGLSVLAKLSDRNVKLFNFDYKEIHSYIGENPKIPRGFKTLNIGEVSLFQTCESKELREAEIDKVRKTLKMLRGLRNPYGIQPGIIGGPGPIWEFKHGRKVQEYKEKLEQLESRLNDEDKKEIEITSHIHDLLLEDFGLTNEDFIEKDKTNLNKTLVRKMPNLTITNHIKYI